MLCMSQYSEYVWEVFMTDMKKKPSSASAPDLDWSQVRETIMMLHLAVAQIDFAMTEGDESVNELGESFTSMSQEVKDIARLVESMAGEQDENKQAVLMHCDNVGKRMGSAIVAFQFYDKLSQRVSHVSHALESLAEVVAEPAALYNPTSWKKLQEQISSKYSTREESTIFDMLHEGKSVKEVRDALREMRSESDDEDDIFF